VTMSPGVRKLALIVHLVVSVGWIGAVIAYLGLDVVAVASTDAQAVQASFIAMDITARWVILPLALATLATGLVMSLGSAWGLFRHYWVLISFALTLVATVVLIGHLADVRGMADAARQGSDTSHASTTHASGSVGPNAGRGDFLHAGGGLVVLLVVTVLNVYKPRGLTPYGWRKQVERAERSGREVISA